MNQGPVSINAVLIVRDEERCIERALSSVARIVTAMIVLDTGSTDRTREIAASCGASVSDWPWRDDFAAARNAALGLSDADVNLILDADEWLASGGDFLSGSARAALASNVGLADVRSTSRADGHDVSQVTTSERLLPRGVRYVGTIHESPDHALPTMSTPLVFGHDGYEAEHQQRKGDRNERLLRAELARRPGDAYLCYQLGKELQTRERWEPAARLYLQALRGVPAQAPWHHPLVVRAISVLGKAGLFGEAVQLFDSEQDRWSESPDFYFAAGNLFLDMALADPASAGDLLPLVEAGWLRCVEIGERPDLPGAVAGRGSTLAAANLAGYYETVGDNVRTRHFRSLAGG